MDPIRQQNPGTQDPNISQNDLPESINPPQQQQPIKISIPFFGMQQQQQPVEEQQDQYYSEYDEEDLEEEDLQENLDEEQNINDQQKYQGDQQQYEQNNQEESKENRSAEPNQEQPYEDSEFFQYQQSAKDQSNVQSVIRIPNIESSYSQTPKPSNTIQLNFANMNIGQAQQPEEYYAEESQEIGTYDQIEQDPSQNIESMPQNTGIIIPIYQDQREQQDETEERAKKRKKKSKKSKGSLLDIYDLRKIQVTMEIDPEVKKARIQNIYNFQLKDKSQIDAFIKEQQKKHVTKCYLDLNMHSKFISNLEVGLILPDGQRTSKKCNYPEPQFQTIFQDQIFGNISKDLNTLETQQKTMLNNEHQIPVINIKKILKVNITQENLDESLQQKIQIYTSYLIDHISYFGIKTVQYKVHSQIVKESSLQTKAEQSKGIYFYTTDVYESSKLWMPIVDIPQKQQLKWLLRYIVPSEYSVISSGILIKKQIESSEQKRAFFEYHLNGKDLAAQEKIGFICGKFPYVYKLQELTKTCPNGFHAFFINEKKQDIFKFNNFYEKNIVSITNYLKKLISPEYPCSTNKLVFVPNLFLQNSRKQSIDFSGGFHILDEEILFQRNQLENRHKTYKYLTSCLAFDYFGGSAVEESTDDFWLLLGIRESIGNHYKVLKCGTLLYRYHIMKTIQSLYKKMKHGIERYPLQSTYQPYPQEQHYNEMIYEKCELIMHMLESMIDASYYERIIRQLYQSAQPCISTGLFLNIFRDICGFKLKQFFQNWVQSTSCPTLSATFQYNKKNNSLDLNITQQSAMKDYFAFRQYLKQNIDMNTLFSTPFQGEEFKLSLMRLQSIDSFWVELKRECMRWFTGEVNVMIYLTDGAEINTQQQKMNLKFGKTTESINIPLQTKVKKTIQNKKKEYENMLMYDQEMDKEEEEEGEEGNVHHILDNNSWKFGLNDFELEDYPYGTKNLFDVKNLESPVLWIRVDPDMEYIRKVEVEQEQNNWLFQLLQEKDIIGQIEAIKQLKKFNSELVYEILKSVSINENYFFKVRKVALQNLQKMQTSQFNKYLSHEKFLIKIFNQRNFDTKIGFYKSNDFTKVLEYYFDKYILKVLSRCKEQPLTIKEEIKEQQLSLTKQQSTILPSDNPSNIAISLGESEQPLQKKATDETKFHLSSEQTAQILLKLLQENDNSENPFDDSFYLKQILCSLGNLDNFKYMPEIANEIFRQFRLDHIGKFSPQFAVTKGAIVGYFNMRKQIHIFRTVKKPNIDFRQEDIDWYIEQITQTEQVLDKMNSELDKIIHNNDWPYEISAFIIKNQTKHMFLYQGNSFLKALYMILKRIDQLQSLQQFQLSYDQMRFLVYFVEQNWKKLDFREAYLNNERVIAIINILWKFICLPFSYLDCEFQYWVKRLFHQLYGNEVPPCLKELQIQTGIQSLQILYDDVWVKGEGTTDFARGHDERDKNLARILSSKTAKVVVKTPKIETQHQIRGDDGSIKISLAGIQPSRVEDSSVYNYNPNIQQQQESKFKIALPVLANQDRNRWQTTSERDFDRDQYMQQTEYQNNNDEEEYDEFAAEKMDIDWMQRAWEVLGLIWYHEEAGAFLDPLTEEQLGAYYDEYMRVVERPMDLTTVKSRFKDRRKWYRSPREFISDMLLVFQNCKTFNHETSEIYQAADKLESFFLDKLAEYGLSGYSY